MKNLILISLLLSSSAYSASKLDSKLDSLNIPSDKVTPLLSEENLISVNKRYSSLTNRHELTFSGSNNFNADSHMDTKKRSASYRYHINPKWSLGYRYSDYFNKLTAAGEKLYDEQKILPDSDYSLKSTEGFINYNTVYGKLRLTEDTIVYFDQYLALGYGKISLANGEAQMYTLDAGFAFWLGKNYSFRVGAKNELYRQQKINGDDDVHNVMGYLEFGYLFGGKTI